MESSSGNIKYTVWRFAQCEYDELLGKFWVLGEEKRLTPKTQAVLLALLKAPGHKLTRPQLLESVWGSTQALEQPLSNAIHNLRTAISPDKSADRDNVLRTRHGSGFQIVVPVESRVFEESAREGMRPNPGDSIAGKRDWKLDEPLDHPLDHTLPHSVWIAKRPTTSETHVFRLAVDEKERDALASEIDIFQHLKDKAGPYPGFVQVFDWRLTTKPYFLETEYGGPNLLLWAESQRAHGGLQQEVCLQIMIDLAEAIATMHAAGVLHNDLRPSNIFIGPPTGSGTRHQVRLGNLQAATFFGSEQDEEPSSRHQEAADERLEGAVTTLSGRSQVRTLPGHMQEVSNVYRSPEVAAGAAPGTASDVYALGIVLFQLLCGDFRRPLPSEWEEWIEDAALRQDVAETTVSNPARRLQDAQTLAQRLRTLEERKQRERESRQQFEALQTRAELAEKQLIARKARQPWVLAAFCVLLAGVGTSGWFYSRAARDRDRLKASNLTLSAMNDFLSVDLLSQGNPLIHSSGKEATSQLSLIDAVRTALPKIESRFQDSPQVAGGLHLILGGAFDARTEFVDAEQEFAAAHQDFVRAEGPLSEDALLASIRRDHTLLRTQAAPQIEAATQDMEQEQRLISQLPAISPTLQTWQALTQTGVYLFGAHPERGLPVLAAAVSRAQNTPKFDPMLLIKLKLRFAGIYLRLEDGPNAERAARSAIESITALQGPETPELFEPDMLLEEALYVKGDAQQAKEQSSRDYTRFEKALGPENQLTLAALYMRAQAEGTLGQWDTAIEDELLLHQRERTKPNGAFGRENSLASAANFECHAGRYREGIQHAQQVIEESSEPAVPQPFFSNLGRFVVAYCLVQQQEQANIHTPAQDLRTAGNLLDAVNVDEVSHMPGLTNFAGTFDLTRARLDLLEGRLEEAHGWLQKATPFIQAETADPYERQQLTRTRDALQRATPAPNPRPRSSNVTLGALGSHSRRESASAVALRHQASYKLSSPLSAN